MRSCDLKRHCELACARSSRGWWLPIAMRMFCKDYEITPMRIHAFCFVMKMTLFRSNSVLTLVYVTSFGPDVFM